MTATKQAHITVEDYFALEEKEADIRHEYYDGEVITMTGTSKPHNIIVLNLALALRQRLKGGYCRVFMENVRLEVEGGRHYTYPDVMVTCDGRDRADDYNVRYPVLVVEVLSDSTEALDRGKKASQYRKLPTLQEYVLVSQSECGVELFSRSQAPSWTLTELSAPDSVLNLSCLNLQIPLSEIYEGIQFQEEEGVNG
ncbi:Uma2 family endonuclease [Kamptonema formosum]|uniref:Uma2 family endonuclease n=1 Tax=Kamptonema formosum TaxID=331992 RepID=UPI00037A4888|nr:Uma2 family endonuclease [Oscillatoria sp. PCC 10802]